VSRFPLVAALAAITVVTVGAVFVSPLRAAIPVPEPSSWAIYGLAAIGILLGVRKRFGR